MTVYKIESEPVGPMLNPPHLDELIRESMNEMGWSVTETAARLGCECGTLSRLLNGKAGVSANMAQARRVRIVAEPRTRAMHAKPVLSDARPEER